MRRARSDSPAPSREFLLVAACCRWPPSPDRDALVAARAPDVDWDRVLRVAGRHRVEGLVWQGLRDAAPVPAPVRAAFTDAAGSIARDNLLIAAESLRLDQLFRASGLPLLFVKGITLGKLAYDTITLKRGWDVDILIDPGALPKAAALLRDAGYRCITPAGADSAGALGRWHARSKESIWRHTVTNVHVELHTALVDNPRLLPGLGAHSQSRAVEVLSGRSLWTLVHDELFAYLCVHGASSAWFRLKWLADLAALLSGADVEEVARLYRRSQALGAGRAAAQALLLADHLFATALSAELARELRSDRWNRALFRAAMRLMTGPNETIELHERRLATLPIHLSQLALLPGWRFSLGEASRQIASMAARR